VKRAKLRPMDSPPSYDLPTYTIEEYNALEAFSNVKHDYVDGVIRARCETIEQYVAMEEFSNVKHEFLEGQALAMGGGTYEHSRLAAGLIIQLGIQLQGRGCYVFTSDARVHVPAGELIAYPDVTVCCGKPRDGSEDPLAMVNPTVIIEILSRSTEKYDRRTKFERYKLIESCQEYVLVSQGQQQIEVLRRSDGWGDAEVFRAGGRAKLSSINCEIDVDALYQNALSI